MTSYFALILLVLFVLMLLLFISRAIGRMEQKPRRRIARKRGEWEEGMEVDLRLPYKRFMELYPYSKITYEEYKQLQMRMAFKKAVSSQENKRMVR